MTADDIAKARQVIAGAHRACRRAEIGVGTLVDGWSAALDEVERLKARLKLAADTLTARGATGWDGAV